MPKLTTHQAAGLRSAVEAEYESKRAAATARERFGSVLVFENLEKSAVRHITTLCETLHAYDEKAPLLAPVEVTNPATLSDALEAAANHEEQKAAIYDDLLQVADPHLKDVLLPLWQSVCHLHRPAIADRLHIARRQQPPRPPTHAEVPRP